MRILLLTSCDLCACTNLNMLISKLHKEHEISVMLSFYENKRERGNHLADKKIYYEKDYVRNILFPMLDGNNLGENNNESIEKAHYNNAKTEEPKYLSFNALAKKHSIPMKEISLSTPHEDIFQHTKKFQPDLIFCCRFDYIVKKETFMIPKFGTYNMHSGRLPECAGPDAAFWAMKNSFEYSGCTIHTVTDKIDQGCIFSINNYRLDYSKGVVYNRIQIYELGINSFFSLVSQLENGENIKCIDQDLTNHNYFEVPTENELKSLYTKEFLEIEENSFQDILTKFNGENKDFH